jgi:hypothetical protein
MTALAASEGVNPYVALLVPVLSLVLGAVLTYVFRERSARSDREHAEQAARSRWMREERRSVYARFVTANEEAFNAAAAVGATNEAASERQTRPSAPRTVSVEERAGVEGAYAKAATLFAELQLVCGSDSVVVDAGRELLLFHQSMVNAALGGAARSYDDDHTSNRLTQRFLDVAHEDLAE